MEQIVINDGVEIFNSIQEELTNATNEIIVVSAWFTDEQLLKTLEEKAMQGLRVSVAIAKNKDNEKLDFSSLENYGATVTIIKQKGYGMLHDKYCIIDRKIAFHGSYNWTNNAKKNNKESVIKTNHKNTINQLISQFNMLNQEPESIPLEEKGYKSIVNRLFKHNKIKDIATPPITEQQIDKANENGDVDEIFKSIISAELKKTNRVDIKDNAYSQSKEVSGDPQVITKSMDSLFYLFISDKDNNDAKKELLIKKIDDKVSELTQNIITKQDERVNSIEIETISEEKDLNLQKTTIEGKKSLLVNEKNQIEKNDIPKIENQIDNIKDSVDESDIEYVKPPIKWHELIPTSLFFIGLSIAMILFYSSSAYIMLYAHEDAMLAIKNGINVNPQVFEAGAIRKAFLKDISAGLYVIFFVFIPFTIAYVAHSSVNSDINKHEKLAKKIISYIIVVAIDAFIALKVTKTIIEIKYLSTGIVTNHPFYEDINFWLVFFLGAIPFFFLADIMNKLINIFGERNEQEGREKMLQHKKISLKKVDKLSNDISGLEKKINTLDGSIQEFENQILEIDKKLIYLPKELNLKQRQIKESTNNEIHNLKKKADVFKNDIENDNIQISVSSLKDRVSAFIEGWSEWLHDEYSITKATKKSEEAIKEADLWLENNLKKTELK